MICKCTKCEKQFDSRDEGYIMLEKQRKVIKKLIKEEDDLTQVFYIAYLYYEKEFTIENIMKIIRMWERVYLKY